MKLVFTFICILVFTAHIFGQLNSLTDTLSDEMIAEKFELYNKSHSSALLFLHTDKTIYTNNETIWFSAYLLSKNNEPPDAHNVLSVELIREDNRKVFLQSKYVLESGTGAGNLLLPDTIASGYYQLLAYTNMVDKDQNPIAIFRQEITIKNLNEHGNSIALKTEDNKVGNDTVYTIPASSNDTVTIHINDPVINDTLRFSISSLQNRQVKILVHNYRQAYAFFTINAQSKEQTVTLAVNKMPKGVAVLSVMDNTGRLLTEKLFFAHYDDKINTSIQTDKEEYGNKEKVTVKLRLTDKNGVPVQGMVSVACVQSGRIETEKKQDIETYVYLNNEFGDLPVPAEGRRFDDKAYLKNILQLKGLPRYKWQDLLSISPRDTLREDHSLAFAGSVTNFAGNLNKPVTLALVSDSSLKVMSTDDLGRFAIKNEELIVKPGRKIWMILNQKNNGAYKIDVTDPYPAMNQKLASETIFETRNLNRKILTTKEEALSDFDKSKTLTNVIIKTQTNNHPFYEAKDVRGFNTNACGDYACAMYGDLNCTVWFHDLTRTIVPIKGKIYYKLVLNARGYPILKFLEEYKGCSLEENNKSNTYFLPGIYETKIFYGADYDQPGSPETQYLSTLFWSPAILVNNGEATFSFTTSNTKGKFNIVAQGLSTNDVLFGESSFLVK